MKDYIVSYYLGDMFHSYTITAENEVNAMIDALYRIPETSKPLFHDFKIERVERVWN